MITASITCWSNIELLSLRSIIIVFGEIDDLRPEMIEPDGDIQQTAELLAHDRVPPGLDEEHHESAPPRPEQFASGRPGLQARFIDPVYIRARDPGGHRPLDVPFLVNELPEFLQ